MVLPKRLGGDPSDRWFPKPEFRIDYYRRIRIVVRSPRARNIFVPSDSVEERLARRGQNQLTSHFRYQTELRGELGRLLGVPDQLPVAYERPRMGQRVRDAKLLPKDIDERSKLRHWD